MSLPFLKSLKFGFAIVGVFLFMSSFQLVHGAAMKMEDPSRSLWGLFLAAYPVSFLLAGTFIAGLALTLEHIFSITEEKLAPVDLVADLEALVDEEQYDEALELCQSSDSYYAKVLRGGLVFREAGYEETLHELETVASTETFNLNTKISYLSLIGNIAPLLGLLGTVTGMITSFQIIEKMKNPTPAKMASGIYEALVNTTLGLFVAIIFLAVFFYFKNKVGKLTLKINLMVAEMFKKMHLEHSVGGGR